MNAGLTFALFNRSRNWSPMHWLKFFKKKNGKNVSIIFICLIGSILWMCWLGSVQIINFIVISSKVTFRKKSKFKYIVCFNYKSFIFMFPIFTKKLLKVSIIFSVPDIFLPSLNITLLVPTILFHKFSLTPLQKFLLSVMRLRFIEPWYYFLFLHINEGQ